VSVES